MQAEIDRLRAELGRTRVQLASQAPAPAAGALALAPAALSAQAAAGALPAAAGVPGLQSIVPAQFHASIPPPDPGLLPRDASQQQLAQLPAMGALTHAGPFAGMETRFMGVTPGFSVAPPVAVGPLGFGAGPARPLLPSFNAAAGAPFGAGSFAPAGTQMLSFCTPEQRAQMLAAYRPFLPGVPLVAAPPAAPAPPARPASAAAAAEGAVHAEAEAAGEGQGPPKRRKAAGKAAAALPKAYPDWRDLSSLRHLAAWCTDPANPAHTEYAPPPGQAPCIRWSRGRPSSKQRALEVRAFFERAGEKMEQLRAAPATSGLLELLPPRERLLYAADALQEELLAHPEVGKPEGSPVPSLLRLLSRQAAAAN